MTKYNGHRNWTHWNVSLWINNDESLYNEAKYYIHDSQDRDEAAQRMMDSLTDIGITETPDGAKYSKTAIRAAMVGM